MDGPPLFRCKEVQIGNQSLDFYCRNTLECIRLLYSDATFAQHLAFVPVQVYTDAEQTCHVVNEMHTGDWWWSLQVCTINYDEHGDL
jgi:hypothetical protein